MEVGKFMKNILVVDNDVSTAVTMKAAVEDSPDYKADVTYSGKEALGKMKVSVYDLILLDIMMPELSGIDVCKQMLKDERLKKIPVVLVSALPIASKGFQRSIGNFDELSVVKGVVEKPFDVEDLQVKIKELVER